MDSKTDLDRLADQLQLAGMDLLPLLNLRDSINRARKAGKGEKVKQFEERYARLLLFGAYLQTGTDQSFEEWLGARGALEDFLEKLPLEHRPNPKAA